MNKDVQPNTPCLAMRTRAAAKSLGVSERTLWSWTRAGIIPHIRQGKAVLYSASSLEQWLRQQSKVAESKGGSNE